MAKIAAGGAIGVELAPERALDRHVLEDGLDDEVGLGGASQVVGRARSARASRRAPRRSSRPLATARSRLPAIRSRPASARARSGSYRTTAGRSAACTWAMPWPISPAPATKTRSIELGMATMVRGLGDRRSAWSAAAAAERVEQPVGGRVRVQPVLGHGIEQRRASPAAWASSPSRCAQPIGHDRPDLGLGAGEPRGRRRARATAPPGAGRAPPAAPAPRPRSRRS